MWLLLEEKRIPYRLDKINMRSYGDKPRWFLDKVPNGLLPAIEIDGNFMTDSLPIMQALDQTFSGEGTPRCWRGLSPRLRVATTRQAEAAAVARPMRRMPPRTLERVCWTPARL